MGVMRGGFQVNPSFTKTALEGWAGGRRPGWGVVSWPVMANDNHGKMA
jgi:hypothetical protein